MTEINLGMRGVNRENWDSFFESVKAAIKSEPIDKVTKITIEKNLVRVEKPEPIQS